MADQNIMKTIKDQQNQAKSQTESGKIITWMLK